MMMKIRLGAIMALSQYGILEMTKNKIFGLLVCIGDGPSSIGNPIFMLRFYK